MRINWKIQVREKPVPKSVVHGSLYTIATRNTMLAFHKIAFQRDRDPMCTKTGLLMFAYEYDANEIANMIEETQRKIMKLDRDIYADAENPSLLESRLVEHIFCQEAVGDSLKPIHIEAIHYNQLEQLCLLHHFDMLIVYHKKIHTNDPEDYQVDLDCYEYITKEPPNRVMLEKIFRDMLYFRDDPG